MKRMLSTLCGLLLCQPLQADNSITPNTEALFNHQLKRLHSSDIINLRERYAGHPLLIINTASFCGFTGQFEGLEALHQAYKGQGLKVIGFPSNDFRQEAGNEERTAEVCFINYGVSFDMFSPVAVRGDQAHPIFRELARQSGTAPKWNFYKYVIDRNGKVTAHFSSMTKPDDTRLRQAIEAVL